MSICADCGIVLLFASCHHVSAYQSLFAPSVGLRSIYWSVRLFEAEVSIALRPAWDYRNVTVRHCSVLGAMRLFIGDLESKIVRFAFGSFARENATTSGAMRNACHIRNLEADTTIESLLRPCSAAH